MFRLVIELDAASLAIPKLFCLVELCGSVALGESLFVNPSPTFSEQNPPSIWEYQGQLRNQPSLLGQTAFI